MPVEELLIPLTKEQTQSTDPEFEFVRWPIVDVHTVLGWLWKDAQLEIPQDEVVHFWNTSRANNEQWAVRSNAPNTCVPIGLYGDGARIDLQIGSVNVVGLWLNLPLWRPQSVRYSRILLCAVPEKRLYKHYTLNAIYRRITWSANCAYIGRHPCTDPAGNPLPPHMSRLSGQEICSARFAVTEIRGD